jgi:lipopolysaccharide assembly outer membrane protein LptD (OstA)
MKLLALFLASVTVFPILSQDKPARERRACLLVSNNPKVLKCQSTLFGGAQEWARTAQVGDKWQPVGDDPITVTLEANGIQSDRDITRLTGNVEIHTTKLILLADQAVYHGATGAIDASGNVHVAPVGK